MDHYKGVYAKMQFPEYEFKEYPKIIELAGKRITVVDAHDEAMKRSEAGERDAPAAKNPLTDDVRMLTDRMLELEEQNKKLMAALDKYQTTPTIPVAKVSSPSTPSRPSAIPTPAKPPSESKPT